MNNPKSTALGWGALVAAAGISYYYARQGIDERREKQKSEGSRPTEKLDWRQKVEREASAQEAFAQAKEKTGNTAPKPKAGPPTGEEVAQQEYHGP